MILGALVLIHELGHFVTARWAKVRVLEFGIGFPPRAKVLGRGKPDPAGPRAARCVRARAPAGDRARHARGRRVPRDGGGARHQPPGHAVHAQLAADRRLRQARGRGRRQRRRPARLLARPAAGQARHPGRRASLMNLLLAFVIFTGLALWGEPQIGVRIGEVVAGAPAAASGLVAGDTIVTINGTRYSAFGNPEQAIDDLQANGGQAVDARDPARRRHRRATSRVVLRTPTRGAAGRARDPRLGRRDRRHDRQHVRARRSRPAPSARSRRSASILGRARRPRPARSSPTPRRRRRRPDRSGSRSSWATSCGASARCT